MGIRIYSNSFSNPEYYLYSYLLKVDLTNNICIRIRVKISIRYNTGGSLKTKWFIKGCVGGWGPNLWTSPVSKEEN